MSEQEEISERDRVTIRQRRIAAVVALVLVILATPVFFAFAVGGSMATDSCGGSGGRLVCRSSAVASLLFFLPVASYLVALLGSVGLLVAAKSKGPRWEWGAASVLVVSSTCFFGMLMIHPA